MASLDRNGVLIVKGITPERTLDPWIIIGSLPWFAMHLAQPLHTWAKKKSSKFLLAYNTCKASLP